tara:strand:+ start:7826 stop:8956 length:1131 start_codon:yes stop_codon:yes gene_type:complete
MDKLIFRKLSQDIFSFFLLSSLAITVIIWVIQGVNLLDIVSEDGHAIQVYFSYSILTIPKIFSKLLIFTYFLTLFIILNRYEENNEILVFWTNGIKKISFINFIARLSIAFVLLQLFLSTIVVPYSQNLAQEYLKNSSIEFFPKLIQEKKFTNLMNNLTIFADQYDINGVLKGIYIKEKINDSDYKIIIASEGNLIKSKNGYNFKLYDGKITNIDSRGNFNLGFKETVYELSTLGSKTRKEKKLSETSSLFLFDCLENFLDFRKDTKIRCGNENSFLIKDIYEEFFQRIIQPIYIIILSLLSSSIILKSKIKFLPNYYKSFLFILGFSIIIFSELSYKFVGYSNLTEIIFIFLPIIFIIFFYFIILIKSKFNLSYL